jgi:restriction modification system DNA specificity domain protein
MAGVMKDSEVEWIGEIPEGWDISKVKYVGRYINGYAFKPDQWGQDGLPIIRIQNLSGSSKSINYFDGKISDDYLIDDGDILISWSATLDAFIWNYGKGWLNQHIFKAIPNVQKIHKSYFFHLMKIAMLNMSSDKHGSAMQHVTNQIFGNFQVPLPSLSEQKLIADFLDEKCAEIDNLSEDIQKQIDILNDYKKSIITRAVTKGLDPNVEMKDSGDERLDMIPANWDAKKLKFVTREIYENGLMVPENDKYIGMENVLSYSNDFHETNTEYEISFQKKCKKGVVLFGKLRPYLAKVIICPFTGFATGEFMQLSNFDGDSRYLRYSLLNRTFIEFVNMSTYGAKMPRANSEYINNLKICIPPKDEQCKIADFLDNVCQKIDESIRLQQKQLSHLDTYKRSIIYEYVTGKKRVKGTL